MVAEPLYTVANCSFRYGTTEILSALTFNLYPGKFYGLIGPNGSGKSTLINLLMAGIQPYSGSVQFKNTTIQNFKQHTLAQYISFVPQDINIGFDFTVYDIVLMGRHPHIPRFHSPTTKDLQIVEDVIDLLDVAHVRTRPVTQLSGGEKQRVIVARALAQDTEVLILDEATSNLDIEHTIEILRVLRKRVDESGRTVIAALHDLNLAAAFCDELLVLKDTHLHESGPVQTVLTTTLLEDVFSVKGRVSCNGTHPRIEYEMLLHR
jgi:ABC-type cobalamin/Fe3+-siderophores transport system ATPase subunit